MVTITLGIGLFLFLLLLLLLQRSHSAGRFAAISLFVSRNVEPGPGQMAAIKKRISLSRAFLTFLMSASGILKQNL